MANTGKSYKCSICGSYDHTKRNHGKVETLISSPAPVVSESDKSRVCSCCYQSGHNVRTCSLAKAERLDRLAAQRRAAEAILGYSFAEPARRWVSAHVAP